MIRTILCGLFHGKHRKQYISRYIVALAYCDKCKRSRKPTFREVFWGPR